MRIYTGLANGTGAFTFPAFQDVTLEELAQTAITADVNNDGRKDIVINYLDTINRTYVGLSIGNQFDFSRENQLHPDLADWSQYSLSAGDLNGDDKEDLIWIQPSGVLSIYVALVKE